jgi:hypothetical protein
LGIGDWAQSPIPNPQSPIPNPQSPLALYSKKLHVILIYNNLDKNNIKKIILIKNVLFRKRNNIRHSIN